MMVEGKRKKRKRKGKKGEWRGEEETREAEFQTERWQQLVGREFGGKNDPNTMTGKHAERYITFFWWRREQE